MGNLLSYGDLRTRRQIVKERAAASVEIRCYASAAENAMDLRRMSFALEARAHPVVAVRTDVSKPGDVEALSQKTLDAFGAVHVLCNNSGVVAARLIFAAVGRERVHETSASSRRTRTFGKGWTNGKNECIIPSILGGRAASGRLQTSCFQSSFFQLKELPHG